MKFLFGIMIFVAGIELMVGLFGDASIRAERFAFAAAMLAAVAAMKGEL